MLEIKRIRETELKGPITLWVTGGIKESGKIWIYFGIWVKSTVLSSKKRLRIIIRSTRFPRGASRRLPMVISITILLVPSKHNESEWFENQRRDHPSWNLLICSQLFSTNAVGSVLILERRLDTLILGSKGLTLYAPIVISVKFLPIISTHS